MIPKRAEARVLVAGGGTGGHIFTGLCVVEAMCRMRPIEVMFVGTRRGLEEQLIGQKEIQLAWIDMDGIQGKGWRGWCGFFWRAPKSLWQSFRLVRSFRPGLAIGLGGYSSGPVLWVASRMGVATLIIEPNVLPGMTNRWLKNWVDAIAVAFQETRKYLGNRCEITGIPVRSAFFSGRHTRRPDGTFRMLLFGGSQGSHRLNQLWTAALPILAEKWDPSWGRLQIIHQTGEKDYQWVQRCYQGTPFSFEVCAFIQHMPEEFAQASLILSRAGAGTVGELCAAGRAGILVPFPHSAEQHQAANARVLERQGAALTVAENRLDGDRLAEIVMSLAADPQRREKMEKAAGAMVQEDAAGKIAALAWQLMDRKAA